MVQTSTLSDPSLLHKIPGAVGWGGLGWVGFGSLAGELAVGMGTLGGLISVCASQFRLLHGFDLRMVTKERAPGTAL